MNRFHAIGFARFKNSTTAHVWAVDLWTLEYCLLIEGTNIRTYFTKDKIDTANKRKDGAVIEVLTGGGPNALRELDTLL